jgi:4-diphosphocytidyl-2-C-methyl-D-erythritol kinase
MWTALSIDAPCKINLHLRVTGRRSDGFHALESIFLTLEFGDTLYFELCRGSEMGNDVLLIEDLRPVGVGMFREELSREDNSIRRAIDLFRAKTGFARPLRIRLEKRVPLGAGLGGGSSDGASTLQALNELAETALSGEELRTMAAELGSDVPFFLNGGAALVTGRGECIRPIAGPPHLPVLLVNPGFPSNTAEAFRLLDARQAEFPPDGAGLADAEPAPDQDALISALADPPSQWPYGNDFLPVFLARGAPKVRDAYGVILGELKAQGADFCGLTGSGSTCFGIFTDGGMAEKAAKSLSKSGFFTLLTFPLARLANAVLK